MTVAVSSPAVGLVEQAIYTWSSLNVIGGKGQGFGAISPGLARSVAWLATIEPRRFQLTHDAQPPTADGYTDWRTLVAVGGFRAGDRSVVYRKIADAGLDAHGRERFMVHLLVGAAGQLDLASVTDDDPHWLEAADCPLDALPALSPLQDDVFRRRAISHVCDESDTAAAELLATLVGEPGKSIAVSATGAPADTVTALLTAVPAALWPAIELDWFVGTDGPVARIRIGDAPSSDADPSARCEAAGLAACVLHRRVEETWARLPPSNRSWAAFVRSRRAGAPSPRAVQAAREALPLPQAESLPHALAVAAIADILGGPTWSADRRLSEREALLALAALRRLPVPPDGWLATFTRAELWALLAELREASLVRAADFFDQTQASTADLVAVWQATGLAAIGFALLRRDPDPLLTNGWAVPKGGDVVQLHALLVPLLRSGPGLDRVGRLLRGGFAANAAARQRFLRALARAEIPPRHLFETILPRAELPAPLLLEFMRDDAAATSEWLHLSEPYAEALRLGLARRRWLSFPALRPLLRGGGRT